MYLYRKWLSYAVFATPITPQKRLAEMWITLQNSSGILCYYGVVESDSVAPQRVKAITVTQRKESIMTKQEKAMFEEMMGMMKAMGKRIEDLEKSRNNQAKTTTPITAKKATTTPKESAVNGLVFSGKYVKVDSIKNSKVRYAIQMAITERFNGTKLSKGNPVYDKAYAKNKYVQVYEFKTLKDAQAFYDDQAKRVG